MSGFWKLIGADKPQENAGNTAIAKKALQRWWVVGTLGAFFAAFARNIPYHINQFSLDPNWEYTLEVVVKYNYLLWLLVYFFSTNLNNEQQETASNDDLIYDVMQSLLALGSAYFMGFITPGSAAGEMSFVFVNVSVYYICMFSIFMFYDEKNRSINIIRYLGALVSLVSILAIVSLQRDPAWCYSDLLLLLLFSQLLLFLLLYAFIRIRISVSVWPAKEKTTRWTQLRQ